MSLNTSSGNRTELILIVAAIAAVAGFRIYILNSFAFEFTDSDQTIMWLAAKDYSQGFFHEPRFYGQDYNTMLEALLAVPLLFAGLPVFKALPIVTSCLTILPFILLSLLSYFNRSKPAAVLILCIPLLLPPEFEMLTSISRGFVTGVAVASICAIPLFVNQSKTNLFFAGLAMVTGYSVNANSILFSIPCFFLLFMNNYDKRIFYIYSGIGITIGLCIHILVALFYIRHPNIIVHSFESEFSFSYLWRGITHLDLFFNYLTPILKKQGWIILVLFALISFFLFRKKKYKEALTLIVIILIIILPFSASKIHDGTTSVFFHHARMYLSVPLLLALSISFLEIKRKLFFYIFLLTVPFFYVKKIIDTPEIIKHNLHKNHVVSIKKTNEVLSECKQISELSATYNIQLVVINDHIYYDIYTYGCPACTDNFPQTLRPVYERRIWRLYEDEKRVYENIMIIDMGRKLDEEFTTISALTQMPGFYLIQNNNIPTLHLMRQLNIPVRNYK